ncbi:hypothetical protein WAI453_007975 [Rhynchosporium graminicola]
MVKTTVANAKCRKAVMTFERQLRAEPELPPYCVGEGSQKTFDNDSGSLRRISEVSASLSTLKTSCKSLKKPKLGAEIAANFQRPQGSSPEAYTSFDESLASESGDNGFLFSNEEDPDLFCVISEWFYTGELPGPPSHISNSRPPNEATA